MSSVLADYIARYVTDMETESLKINNSNEIVFGRNLKKFEVFDEETQRMVRKLLQHIPLELIFVKIKPGIPSLPVLENKNDVYNCVGLQCDFLIARSTTDVQVVGQFDWTSDLLPNIPKLVREHLS